jgi:predicted GNAT superfamily acetyltransferase
VSELTALAEATRGAVAGYTVRRLADRELPLANDLFNRWSPTHRSLAEADWLYRNNPYGEGIVFGAFDARDQLVGVRPAIAWRLVWRGHERMAYQFTDALVAGPHRARGIFGRLVGDMCALAAERDVSLFSFPNANSLPIYLKMGVLEQAAACRTLVNVLAWWKYLQYRRGLRAAPAPSPRGDGGDRVTERGLSLLPIERFPSDFEDVHAEFGRLVTSFTLRRKDFLNWRYFEHPVRRYRVALVQLGDETQGYVVVRMIHQIAHVIDVFVRPTPVVVRAVPRLVTGWARRLGAIAVYFAGSKGHVFEQAFRRAGFLWRRESGAVVLDTRSAGRLAALQGRALASEDVYVAMGDNDAK